MAKPRSMKRDIDRAKKDRAAEKRERRQRAAEGEQPVDPNEPSRPAISEEEVLARLDELHARFEADEVDFEEYELLKGDLMAMLVTD